jgi:hypothetical protein
VGRGVKICVFYGGRTHLNLSKKSLFQMGGRGGMFQRAMHGGGGGGVFNKIKCINA